MLDPFFPILESIPILKTSSQPGEGLQGLPHCHSPVQLVHQVRGVRGVQEAQGALEVLVPELVLVILSAESQLESASGMTPHGPREMVHEFQFLVHSQSGRMRSILLLFRDQHRHPLLHGTYERVRIHCEQSFVVLLLVPFR